MSGGVLSGGGGFVRGDLVRGGFVRERLCPGGGRLSGGILFGYLITDYFRTLSLNVDTNAYMIN